MELRFLEGNFEHGKLKLQYRDMLTGPQGMTDWVDVPCVKGVKEIIMEWCDHVKFELDYEKTRKRWYIGGGWGLWATEETMFCPICGAKKP